MSKAFSLASWNVEHFRDAPERIERVVGFVRSQDPDVFALLEVEGKTVFPSLVQTMPDYHFHITEGKQVQEVLVGVRGSLTAFFTQRVEFKSGNTYLRPGALLTLTIEGLNYSVLFLHTKSNSKPIGLGIRDDQFNRAFAFKKVLDKAAGGPGKANYLFLGDFNVMGMDYPFDKDIPGADELKKLERDAAKVKMRRLAKSRPATWWNGPDSSLPLSDLDQVVASEQMTFKAFQSAEVDVRGWPALTGPAAQGQWIKDYSDHGLIYMVIEKAAG
jgi:endonuclease/exonuclease/phosphatase family metal-dependent hydrolase